MFNTAFITVNNYLKLPVAAALGLCLIACDTDNSSILDLDTLFPQDVISQTVAGGEDDTNTGGTGSGNTTEDTTQDAELPTNVNSPVAPIELSENQIPIQLALLTEGEIITQSRFNGTGDPIVDRFTLPTSGYELSPDGQIAALRAVSGSTITVCTYIFQSAQYMCLRAFDLALDDRVWHLFTMQSNTNGSGVFEFCTIENTENDCLDKLIANPDGTAAITINRANALAQFPDASPYFAYENQATLSSRSTNIAVRSHYVDAMHSLVTAANDIILD